MRVCLVYDCLFPYTVGGAERWYRNLAERLAADGHEVTYITRRQWPRGARPDIPGVEVRVIAPHMELYTRGGRRRILEALVFGAGVFAHLFRSGTRYDVVHTASFPYFSALAAGLLRRPRRYRLVVDWHEVWSNAYWREYLGGIGGAAGNLIQNLCMRIPQSAFCFSRLHAARLRSGGLNGDIRLLEGEYAGNPGVRKPEPSNGTVVFAGRHISEKDPVAVVGAVVSAARIEPGIRGVIFGDGPERDRVLAEIRRWEAEEIVTAPGFVDGEVIEQALASALCMLLPSRREGYGLIVVEAASLGVPSIVVAAEDNAAIELIVEGENGMIASSVGPDVLAEAIIAVSQRGEALRDTTLSWFRSNARRLSLSASLDHVMAVYGSLSASEEPSTPS
jgi:glycosyltransferase involved in cell wall biosynthesis